MVWQSVLFVFDVCWAVYQGHIGRACDLQREYTKRLQLRIDWSQGRVKEATHTVRVFPSFGGGFREHSDLKPPVVWQNTVFSHQTRAGLDPLTVSLNVGFCSWFFLDSLLTVADSLSCFSLSFCPVPSFLLYSLTFKCSKGRTNLKYPTYMFVLVVLFFLSFCG